ncbi:hypothetical protein ACEWY4_020838 [Coilia grayii]|uniref:GB1/RHD3-type G domain-containing protein n=1 Tax=Coilia grayii TaxID=363190 RepID=A0ABD1J910_9TELE
MKEPVCLISNEGSGGLSVSPGALDILQQLEQPVVVVSVVGLYRTGKSYLMNRLAGRQTGFALGNTIESKTKGIWMWCVPHPSKSGHTLVLLDTEGLGDVNKGDSKHDTKIFALAVLLSSTLVYNSRGTIDNRAIEELQYVTELTEFIKIKASDEDGDDSQFVKFFPNFIWAVRDFTLEAKIDGKDVSGDEYLEYALQLKRGSSRTVMEYNLPRECIRKYFPSRRCFMFPFPTREDNMSRLESLESDELSPAFLNIAEQFCRFVFEESKVKLLKDGYKVNGKVLGHLAQMYVDSISRGDMPCLENAVVAISQLENKAALEEGVRAYLGGMEHLKQSFPLGLSAISSEHQRLCSTAIQEFVKRCFKDDDGKYLKLLENAIDQHFEQYLHHNEEASKQKCQDLLANLSAELNQGLQEGLYAKPGGYKLFCQEMEGIVEKYNSQTSEVVKAKEVLEEFLKNKHVESEAIRQADAKLSEQEKQIDEEKEKAVLLHQKMKAEEEKKNKLEAKMKADRKKFEEKMTKLTEKNEEEKRRGEVEFERILQMKMSEQKDMMDRGFEMQAEKMKLEIEETRRQHEESRSAQAKQFELTMESMKKDRKEQEQRHDQNIAQMMQQHEQTILQMQHQHQQAMAKLEQQKDAKCKVM